MELPCCHDFRYKPSNAFPLKLAKKVTLCIQQTFNDSSSVSASSPYVTTVITFQYPIIGNLEKRAAAATLSIT